MLCLYRQTYEHHGDPFSTNQALILLCCYHEMFRGKEILEVLLPHNQDQHQLNVLGLRVFSCHFH